MNDFSFARFTRRLFDLLIAVCFLGAIIASAQPLLSCKTGYDTILIRGFNLMEFSALGCVPVLTPPLLLFIIFSSLDRKIKEVGIIVFLLLVTICYCHSFIEAREWLMDASDTRIIYHPCTLFFPMAVLFEGITWIIKTLTLDRYDSITCITFLVPWNWYL